jgi:DNA-binding CsgD family transcriptional regulator
VDTNRISDLSPRERECLALTAQLHSSKEIARQLQIRASTVDGYLNSATMKLGAASRRDAARLFLAHAANSTPYFLRGQDSWVGEPALVKADLTGQDIDPDTAVGENKSFLEIDLFRKGRSNNSSTIRERLKAIVITSLIIVVLFASSVVVIETLSELFSKR